MRMKKKNHIMSWEVIANKGRMIAYGWILQVGEVRTARVCDNWTNWFSFSGNKEKEKNKAQDYKKHEKKQIFGLC